MIASKDMVVRNTGLKATFVRGETESFIDVTISTSAIANQIINWEVSQIETLTDHHRLRLKLRDQTRRIEEERREEG